MNVEHAIFRDCLRPGLNDHSGELCSDLEQNQRYLSQRIAFGTRSDLQSYLGVFKSGVSLRSP